MTIFRKFIIAAVALLAAGSAVSTAQAQSLQAQCDAYARNAAAPYGRGGNVVGGALLGAGAGAVLGGITGGKRSIGKGAIIGGAAGAAGGAVAQNRQWRRAYDNAYYNCMQQNTRQPVRKVYGRPQPWTDEWYAYCAAKYRSFDARSGTYQPYNGPRKLCR